MEIIETYLQNRNKSLMHLELIDIILLSTIDSSIQVRNIDVRICYQSGASI